jgi:hypothetical protein
VHLVNLIIRLRANRTKQKDKDLKSHTVSPKTHRGLPQKWKEKLSLRERWVPRGHQHLRLHQGACFVTLNLVGKKAPQTMVL